MSGERDDGMRDDGARVGGAATVPSSGSRTRHADASAEAVPTGDGLSGNGAAGPHGLSSGLPGADRGVNLAPPDGRPGASGTGPVRFGDDESGVDARALPTGRDDGAGTASADPVVLSAVEPTPVPGARRGDGRVAIDIRGVDLLFGPTAGRRAALEALDAGCDREEILERTGMVLGVADASLAVPEGSLSVLMGLSGSGKSSLLRCVNGLNRITRGSLTVRSGGEPVELAGLRGRALRELRRRRLAMVFQQFGLLPWATVRENVAFGLDVRGESAAETRRTVDEQLELVHLGPWADKRIDQLSGGMQQRVGLARAFATNADILLMDEPFSALDPLIREHLQDELLTLQRRLGKTILFVSHDLDEALKLGDRITLMEGGRIVQSGTAHDIVFTPATDYVRRFVANVNPLSVLSAATVMRPLRPGGEFVALPERQGRLRLVGERPVVLLVGVEALALEPLADGSVPPEKVATVDLGTPVRELVRQASVSPRPIVVTGAEGRLEGLVLPGDILRALAARLGSEEAGTAADNVPVP